MSEQTGEATGDQATEAISFGRWISRAREKKGMSLDDLSHQTKIRRAILQSLEADSRRELPEKVFVAGYVRAYALAVGIDVEESLRRFHASWSDGVEASVSEAAVVSQRASLAWLGPVGAAAIAGGVFWYIVTQL